MVSEPAQPWSLGVNKDACWVSGKGRAVTRQAAHGVVIQAPVFWGFACSCFSAVLGGLEEDAFPSMNPILFLADSNYTCLAAGS